MRARPLSEIAAVVGGARRGPDVSIEGVATDHREVRRGDLFVAIAGSRVDGHAFVPDAMRAGAAAALTSAERPEEPAVVVEDTRAALRSLARDERERSDASVVGITGSTGKTTVKDLTASILATRLRVFASPRSFNTEVGLPVAILNAPADVEALVLEMGSRGIGHVATLCSIARPSVGAVTGVGLAHMEMFERLETVADAKAELVEALPPDGTAVLNEDDPVVRTFAARTGARVLRYGLGPEADVRAVDVVLDEAGRPSFTLVAPDGAERVDLPLLGEHMVANALAGAAVGVALGLSVGECATGLKDARASAGRMQLLDAEGGIRILNDAYNANPTSMAAALKALRWMARDGRSIAVLGEMAELGSFAATEHERVGELVARLGIDHLVVVGDRARAIAIGAEREGVEPERIVRCDSIEEATGAVRRMAGPGDVILLKGSRVAGLERVAEALA